MASLITESVGSLFSEISGKFSRSLILGSFFPIVFFLLLDWMLVHPFLPPFKDAVGPLAALEPQWQALVLVGLAVLLSGLLYALNRPITRLYEGYSWQHSFMGQWLGRHEARRWRRTRGLAWGLDAVLRTPDGEGREATGEDAQALSTLSDNMLRRFHQEFPSTRGSVLPTRLGNTLRSYEDYPQRQYRMSSIYLWPRMLGSVDKEYAAAIDDTKSSFDFMMNVSFLSGLSALGLLLMGLASRGIDGLSPAFWLQVAGLMVACRVFYAGSIWQAMAWGDLVRGAFDLYRGKLLSQMGFAQKPADLHEERELWRAISLQMIFGDPPGHTGLPLLRYGKGGTFAVGTPSKPLDVSRSVKQTDGGWQTCLLIHNPHDLRVEEVCVTDSLPDGERYLWGSASSEGQALAVSGTDPITLSVGAMEPDERRIVVYRSIKVSETK
jgi:hypothetical protein